MVELAERLGLDGWVRNRIDGTVEALAVGSTDAVETLIAACHDGPPAARVDLVEVETAQGIVAAGFSQKPTV
jgi:acylphosphatase